MDVKSPFPFRGGSGRCDGETEDDFTKQKQELEKNKESGMLEPKILTIGVGDIATSSVGFRTF